MMSAGSVLTPFSDPTTPVGMLVLGLSAVMTGTGSAVLFLCWIELESGLGGRLALVELASSLCIAFVVGFLLIVGPAIPVIVLIVVMPVLSAAALRRSAPDTPQLPREPEQPLSRHTATLFAKALLGAVLIGVFEWNNPSTLGRLPVGERIGAALLHSTDARSSGLATLDVGGDVPVDVARPGRAHVHRRRFGVGRRGASR